MICKEIIPLNKLLHRLFYYLKIKIPKIKITKISLKVKLSIITKINKMKMFLVL